MQLDTSFLAGAALVPAAVLVLVLVLRRILIAVPERHEMLQLRFGKLHRRITEPGLLGSTRLAPYDRWIPVSRQRDERVIRGIESNDAQGTMVRVDLRVTFRISDSERAMFAVHDWEETLESTTVHEAASALAGKERALFLRSAPELSQALTEGAVRGQPLGHVEPHAADPVPRRVEIRVQRRGEAPRRFHEGGHFSRRWQRPT